MRIAGADLVADPLAAKRSLGFIPDRPFIYEKLTGMEFLRFAAGLYGAQGKAVDHRAEEFLALFDLEPWRDELVESYSHGMRQKLIIASAFVHEPAVIVVDEPMVGLDPKSSRTLKELFRRYTDDGHTVMMSTHTLEVAEGMCDRIGIMQRGLLVACGTMRELRAEHEADRPRGHLPPAHGGEDHARRGRGAACLRAAGARAGAARAAGILHLLAPKWRIARARAEVGRRHAALAGDRAGGHRHAGFFCGRVRDLPAAS